MHILFMFTSIFSFILTLTLSHPDDVYAPLQEFIQGDLCIFDTPPRTTFNRVTLAALYPPVDQVASSCGYLCRTSQELKKVFGVEKFIWSDLVPISPFAGTTFRAQDMSGLLRFFESRSDAAWAITENWSSRLADLMQMEHDAGDSLPTCVWAGKIVDTAREWLLEMGSFKLVATLFKTPWAAVNVMVTRLGTRFLSIEGAVHPSAFLSGHGCSWATTLFRETYTMVNVISNYVIDGELILDFKGLLEKMKFDGLQETRNMIDGLNALGVPNEDGFLPKALRHLRKLCWSNALQILMPLKESFQRQEVFLLFLRKMPAVVLSRLADEGFRLAFYDMMTKLSKISRNLLIFC